MNNDDDDMPPLPEPDRTMWQHGQQIDHFTADQMRAYAQALLDAQKDELEQALKEAMDWHKGITDKLAS